MAQTQTSLQDDYDSCLEDIAEAKGILDEAYDPESTREDLAKAIGEALDVLEDYESEGETDQDETDQDDDLD